MATGEKNHDVWDALANPSRRRVLDLLSDSPRTTGELADEFSDISRYAVMQHLDLLVEVGLVLHRYQGRYRINYLNPVPLQRAYERWMRDHLWKVGQAVTALERHFEMEREEERIMKSGDHRMVRIEAEAEIAADPERVFRALTTGLDEWWPHRSRAGAAVVYEPRPGGLVYEDWGEGQGILYGTVSAYEPPVRAVLVAHGGLGDSAYTSKNIDVVEPRPAGALYKKTLLLWGVILEETESMFRNGTGVLAQALKEFLESESKNENPGPQNADRGRQGQDS